MKTTIFLRFAQNKKQKVNNNFNGNMGNEKNKLPDKKRENIFLVGLIKLPALKCHEEFITENRCYSDVETW